MIDGSEKKIAKSIREEFEDKKLIDKTKIEQIEENLISGEISEESWKLMAELSLAKEGDKDVEKN